MKITACNAELHSLDCDALVVTATDSPQLEGSAARLDAVSSGFFSKLLDRGELPMGVGKSALFHHVPGVTAPVVVVTGLGPQPKFTAREAFRAAGTAAKALASKVRNQVAFDFGELGSEQLAAAVVGAINGCHGQDLLRQEKSLHPFAEILWSSSRESDLARGEVLGNALRLTRELVNLPPNLMYPEEFVRRSAAVAVSCGLEMEVWDELRLRRENCGSLLAVARGSSRPPRLMILRYPGKSAKPPLALVGKGVTFDSGGLSLKPSDSMITMKCDMAGAATVLGTMQALAQMGVDRPVVGLVGLVENMISGASYKLGDVLTARNGKTIEVHNTDAEGRLVLADVLDVALDEKPAQIIDLATLTGACVVALGLDIAGLMSNDAELQAKLQSASAAAGEEVWPLPMSDHFSEQVRGKVGDLKNMGDGRWGGAITAAKFLQEFVGDTPWVHVDIAGPAFYDSPKPFMDAGGTGVMIRSLVQLIETL